MLESAPVSCAGGRVVGKTVAADMPLLRDLATASIRQGGAIALLAAYLLLSTAKKRLGGVTGDVFGCLVELTECAVLIVCCV